MSIIYKADRSTYLAQRAEANGDWKGESHRKRAHNGGARTYLMSWIIT